METDVSAKLCIFVFTMNAGLKEKLKSIFTTHGYMVKKEPVKQQASVVVASPMQVDPNLSKPILRHLMIGLTFYWRP